MIRSNVRDVVDEPVDVARVAGLVLVEPGLGGLEQLARPLVFVKDLVLEDDQLLVVDQGAQVGEDHQAPAPETASRKSVATRARMRRLTAARL